MKQSDWVKRIRPQRIMQEWVEESDLQHQAKKWIKAESRKSGVYTNDTNRIRVLSNM